MFSCLLCEFGLPDFVCVLGIYFVVYGWYCVDFDCLLVVL